MFHLAPRQARRAAARLASQSERLQGSKGKLPAPRWDWSLKYRDSTGRLRARHSGRSAGSQAPAPPRDWSPRCRDSTGMLPARHSGPSQGSQAPTGSPPAARWGSFRHSREKRASPLKMESRAQFGTVERNQKAASLNPGCAETQRAAAHKPPAHRYDVLKAIPGPPRIFCTGKDRIRSYAPIITPVCQL